MHVACSGGADSMALLGLLGLLAPREGLRLSVGHVDHGLRSASAAEAAMVHAVATARGLPFEVDRLQLTRGPGLPARARQARRSALREQARRQDAAFIALGHTATDQAETMLLHLARGAGLPGLAAMAEHDPWEAGSPGGWLRPLLALDRAETRALALRLELPFVDDPTNDDHSHPRVRMRHEVLPVLRALNPQAEAALARTAELARQADDALQAWAAHELRGRRSGAAEATAPAAAQGSARVLGVRPVTSAARWSTVGLEQLPKAVRTRMVRAVCHAAGAPEDALTAQTLASIDDALACPGPSRSWDLHPFLRLHVAHGELWTEAAALAPSPERPPLNH